ncbi:MerR family transcriptional regulator [Labilibaculum sp.]|uniref:MerR family transcriptional regulator n=1 Tax=Labilibaculum sp. TaxID=2060723 RepID=UPI0035667933
MPYKEPKIEKLYYTIGEVAEMFDVNTSLIRFWEKEFAIIKPLKNKKGNRLFTPADIENFHLIFHLVKEKGMTLKGAQKKLEENHDDTVNNFEVVSKLKDIRAMLIEMKENLGKENKIEDSTE